LIEEIDVFLALHLKQKIGLMIDVVWSDDTRGAMNIVSEDHVIFEIRSRPVRPATSQMICRSTSA
jgi:hypothetical protein